MHVADLTAEQKAKASACKTPEDILALAREEGFDLSESEFKAIPLATGESWSSCNQDTNSGPY